MINTVIQEHYVDAMKKLEAESINLVIASPPPDMDDFETVAEGLTRPLKRGGVLVWFADPADLNFIKQTLFFKDSCGLRLLDTMIVEYDDEKTVSDERYPCNYDFMFVFSKEKPKTVNLLCDKPNRWAGTGNWGKAKHRGADGVLREIGKTVVVADYSPRNNIWKYRDRGLTPRLASDIIQTWSRPGDVVMNPFMRDEAVLVMAKVMGRNYMGIEKASGKSRQHCNEFTLQ